MVELHEPHHRVIARWRQPARRPRQHGRGSTHHQRRDGSDGEGVAQSAGAVARLQRGERAVEPARIGRTRLGEAALQHVLAVEVGALAVRRGRRMHDGRRAGFVEPMQVGHRRIEGEEGIERQRRRLAVEGERLVTAQREPVRIAHGRDRCESVERAAQHDHEQAWIAPLRARHPRQIGPGEQRAGGDEQFAPGRSVAVECHRLTSFDRSRSRRHRRWNSGAMNISASACGRLSARKMACRVLVEASGASACSNTSRGSASAPRRRAN